MHANAMSIGPTRTSAPRNQERRQIAGVTLLASAGAGCLGQARLRELLALQGEEPAVRLPLALVGIEPVLRASDVGAHDQYSSDAVE